MAVDNRIVHFKKIVINGVTMLLREQPKVKMGGPTINAVSGIAGEGVSIPVFIEDWTNVLSEIILPLFNTVDNITNIRKWQFPPYTGFSAAYAIDENTGVSIVFKNMAIIEDPDYDSQSAELEITLKGAWVKTQN